MWIDGSPKQSWHPKKMPRAHYHSSHASRAEYPLPVVYHRREHPALTQMQNLFPAPTMSIMDPPNDVILANRLSASEAGRDTSIKHLNASFFLLNIWRDSLPSAVSFSVLSTKECWNERKNRHWENVIGTAALCYPTVRASPRGQTVISEEPGLWLTRHLETRHLD